MQCSEHVYLLVPAFWLKIMLKIHSCWKSCSKYTHPRVIISVISRLVPITGLSCLNWNTETAAQRCSAKKGVLICLEGLSLLLLVTYHQKRSIFFPWRQQFSQEVKFTCELLSITQEGAVLKTALFSQEDIPFPEQLKSWQEGEPTSEQARFPRKPNIPISSEQLKLRERWYNFRIIIFAQTFDIFCTRLYLSNYLFSMIKFSIFLFSG